WVSFYHQKWVIASLNKCISQIDKETWKLSPSNTNIAESAYALKGANWIRKNLLQLIFIKNIMYQVMGEIKKAWLVAMFYQLNVK
ncbi:3568_t:CDS:2, partial [Gigaspora rosea]